MNKFSFGDDNFVDCYVSTDAQVLVVEVKDPGKVPGTPWAVESFHRQEGNFFYYDIPLFHRDAVLKFLQGKYSEMGDAAHGMIRAYSGLQWKKERRKEDGTLVTDTDARLLALTKEPILRERLEWLLSYVPDKGRRSTVTIDPDSELISVPSDRDIWKGETKALAL